MNGFERRSKLFWCKSPTLWLKYFPSNSNSLIFFTTFRFASFHFILFLCKLYSLMWIYALKRKKKKWRKGCVYNHGDSYLFRFTYTYANYPSSSGFRWRQKCACLFEHHFYFDYQDFITWASFQRFNAGKLWEMLNWLKSRNTLKDRITWSWSFVLLLSPKQ